MRSAFIATLLFFCATAQSAPVPPYCTASSVLPAGIHLLEAPECFSPDVAEELSSDVGSLEKYLDRFPGVETVHAYRYWQYLRTERFLPALLTLIELVNRAPSLDPAVQFRDEMAFLVISGIKRIPREVNLFDRPGALSVGELSDRFFFIFDQVVSLYAEGSGGSRRDSWLLYRSLSLFFSSTDGPAAAEEPFVKELLGRYYALWKEGVLLPYLSFYSFFTVGDRTFLPTETIYSEKLADLVPLPKSRDEKKERAAIENITRLMGRFSLENISLLPAMEFIETDDVRKWYRADHPTAGKELDEFCAVFDERQAMLAPYRDDLFAPFLYNRALSLMEGCDPLHELPFVIEGKTLYLAAADRWLRDVAVAYYLIRKNNYSYREAGGLLSGALLASIARYRKEGRHTPFGNALVYAYYTDCIADLRDALFLYRQYGNDPSVFTREKTTEAIGFVTSFFLGAKEEEK